VFCTGKELIRNPESLQILKEEAGDKNVQEETEDAQEGTSENEEDEKK